MAILNTYLECLLNTTNEIMDLINTYYLNLLLILILMIFIINSNCIEDE